jgi:hypothetical protein
MANIQEQITKARDAGYSDDEIAQHLSSSPEYSSQMKSAFDAGYSSAEILGHLSATPTAPVAPVNEGIPTPRAPRSWSELPGNIAKSAVQLYSGLLHPIDLVKGVTSVTAGGAGVPEATAMVRKNLPARKQEFSDYDLSRAAGLAQAQQMAGAMGEHFSRYSTLEGIKNAMITDPVGTAADISMLLSGTAGAAQIFNAPRAASLASKAAAYTNPLSPVAVAGKYAYGKLVPQSEKTAAAITRKAAGEDINKIRAILDQDKSGLTVADLLADLDRNQIHALGEVASAKDTTNFYSKLDKFRKQSQETTLNNLAGGATNTEILNNLAKSKEALTQVTTPMRETNLAAANTGKLKQGLEQQAATLGEVAANKVDDVRRFTAARQRLNTAKTQADQSPNVSKDRLKFTGEMEDAAERVATRAAEDSLKYGEGARFAQNRADSLAAHGLTPLDTDGVIRNINAKLKNPDIGVSDVNRKVLSTVANKIKEWTANNGGVIDVRALYRIRKDTVNEVIDSLGKEPKASAKYASKLLAEVRPLIDDAIIKAGGTGWRDYLDTFSHGMDVINQRKMAQVARELYNQPDKSQFLRLVRGESPELVEQIFGHGRIDLKAEMGTKFQALDNIAHELERTSKVKAGAEKGAAHLKDIVKQESPMLRIPMFGLKARVGNEVLRELSGRINDKTLQILERGFQSGKNFEDMLNEVPFGDRGRVYNALQKVNRTQFTGAASVSNMLAPQNRNELRN